MGQIPLGHRPIPRRTHIFVPYRMFALIGGIFLVDAVGSLILLSIHTPVMMFKAIEIERNGRKLP